ncbi:MAG: nucleotidyltransferase domain-containing protein [Rhizomicrobium sp.]
MTKNGFHRMHRLIPSSMDSTIVAQIDARLAAIRQEHNVRIPLAIESGSRAWGFPSPTSDYDCRFIYVRPVDEYLSLWPGRDVIETPLDDLLDVNGWDLRKALKLLLKGNAVVIEWLTSPISYATDLEFKDGFVALARKVADRFLIGRHYLHLGERQRRTYFRDGKPVPQKKIFYALRPAAALRWLRLHPEEAVAPMHFPALLAECAPPDDVAEIVDNLIVRKAATRELGSTLLPEPIRQFIDEEFQRAREVFEGPSRFPSPDARQRCDDFFVANVAEG